MAEDDIFSNKTSGKLITIVDTAHNQVKEATHREDNSIFLYKIESKLP